MASVFVQIASYHDNELPNTINNVLESASGKNQINIGVSHCFFEENTIDMPKLPSVKYTVSKAPENIGLGVGRLLAHEFYDGEDYYLQIDGHSRLDPNWDEKLIKWVKDYQAMGFKKPLLTCYPRNYWYEEDNLVVEQSNLATQILFIQKPEQFKEILIPTQQAHVNPEGNVFSNSVSGGSIFTVGDFIKPNPKVAFYGEEIFIAARAFTNGFDLLLPKHQFMAHLYYNSTTPTVNRRRLVWSDFPSIFSELDVISRKEIFDMLRYNIISPEHLGTDRTLQEYEMRCGLDFKTGTLVERC